MRGLGRAVQSPEPTRSPVALRRALAEFCTGVTVVSASVPGSAPRGMTASAFMSGSLAPPLVIVSIQTRARLHATVSASDAYGVSILPARLEREARRFAGLPVGDHEPAPDFAWRHDVPVLAGATAWFAARVVKRWEIGDHTIFVGEVAGFGVEDDPGAPLAYHRSVFAQIAHLPSEALSIDPWDGIVDRWG